MNEATIGPDWPAPTGIESVVTTRAGGVSSGAWQSLNLGDHVDDEPAAVAQNRQLLRTNLALPADPLWLSQVHGTVVVDASLVRPGVVPTADAAWTDQPNRVLAVMTADCLPVLLTSRCGAVIAAAHGGWRGLAGGIVSQTVGALPVPADQLIAWLGPAIGPNHFEVGVDVLEAFTALDSAFGRYFCARAGLSGKYLADIYGLARAQLRATGVTEVYGGQHCTVTDPRFYSYRRDGGITGRMAALIWRR